LPLFTYSIFSCIGDAENAVPLWLCQVTCLSSTNRTVLGTNNYKPHYKKFHPGIPTTPEEAIKKRKETQEKENKAFFKKPEDEQTYD